ncbi:hypothetical protein TELCIR_16186, partial [Teladorsagia circumcincta]
MEGSFKKRLRATGSNDAKQLETVNKFTYLGSVIAYDGDAKTDARIRIAKEAAVFDFSQERQATSQQKMSTEEVHDVIMEDQEQNAPPE